MRKIALLASLLILSSCAALQQAKLVQKPKVTDWKVKLTGATFDDISLEYRLKLANPNPVGLTVQNYSYSISVEQNLLTKGSQTNATELKANDSMWVAIPFTFTYKELYNLGKAYVKSDSLTLGFKSDFGLDIPVLGLISVPFETTYSIPMLKRPSVKISSFKLGKVSLLGASFNLKLAVDNPNSIPIDLGKIGLNFKVNGTSWLSSALESTGPLPSNGIKEINIPFSISFTDVGLSVFNSIRNGDPFSYAIDADVQVKLPLFDSDLINVPIRTSGELKLF